MKCIAVTKTGKRCGIDAEDSTGLCHVHHPHMTYRMTHPDMKVRTIYDQVPAQQETLELEYEKARPPKKRDKPLNEYQYSQPGDDVPWKE